jgi:hypothetical protein
MTKIAVARTVSPLIGFLAALALVAAALLAGMLSSAGHDQAGAVWNKTTHAGAVWNKTPSNQAGAVWNKVGGHSTDGAVWN